MPTSADQRLKQLYIVMVITFVIMLCEFVGGYLADSLALMSDAVHMLTDFVSLILAVIATRLAKRPRDKNLSFGYRKAEVFGALLNGLFLWIVSAFLIYFAIKRMRTPEIVDGPLVAGIAVIGLVSNLISMKILAHSQKENLNVRGAYLHIISDLLGSIGALIAGVVIWITGWYPIDPILTIVFTALILSSAWKMIKDSILVLMDSVPLHLDYQVIKDDILSLDGVIEVHDMHLWSLSDKEVSFTAHIVSKEGDRLLNEVTELLNSKYKISHVTLQMEKPGHFN